MKIRIGSSSQSKVLIQREQLQEKSNFIWQISVRKMQPGILTEWKRVDLTPLGKVHRLNFNMTSSDGEGMWINTPTYFCMDDIAITY